MSDKNWDKVFRSHHGGKLTYQSHIDLGNRLFMEKIYLFVQCEAISNDLSADLGILQDSDAFFRIFLDAYRGRL